MFEPQLEQSGLTKNQALVYEALLKTGAAPAREILAAIPLKRGLAYKVLDELSGLGLVNKKDEPGKITVFEPAHPSKLKEIAETKEKQAQNAQIALDGILGQLSSDFNLSAGKPGVRFYEGVEGVKKVLLDTLTSNPDKKLYVLSGFASYADVLLDWNTKHYAPLRKRLGIHEQVIVPNDARALELLKNYKANEITEFLFIDHNLFPFSTEINIYNNKVSFVTFSAQFNVGIIVDNKEIHDTMRAIFALTWELGRKNLKALQPPWLAVESQPQPAAIEPQAPPNNAGQNAANPK